jgi:hypothetical protein
MITATTARANFFNFSSTEPPNNTPLPVATPTDIAFQILLTAESEAEADSIGTGAIILYVMSQDGTTQLHDYHLDGYLFQQYRTGPHTVLIFWPHGLPNIASYVDANTCFRLAIEIVPDVVTHYMAAGPVLKLITEPKYTSVLEYSCEENSYGFTYCYAYTPNRVRLPLYLYRPQFNDEESIYTRHDGSLFITKSVTKKEYLGTVDYINEAYHEKIKIALSHDTVLIYSDVYNGGLRKNGGYEIEWQELPGYSTEAPAKFKGFATPYLVRNDNCAVCNNFCYPPVGVTSTPVLPDAVIGVAYSFSFTVNGMAPFVLNVGARPSWMEITMVGDEIFFAGTPDEEIAEAPVSLTVFNCELVNFYDFSDSIDVLAEGTCIGVAVITPPPMPNAVVGTGYFFMFPFTGTPPMALGSIVKPAWMNINISGSTVEFTGIPDVAGTGLNVQVQVTNCDDDFYDFADTMDVAEAPPPPEDIILTITALYFDTSFSASLNFAISETLTIANTFSDSFNTCGASAVGSMQHVPGAILTAGMTGITYDSLSNTGTQTPHNTVLNPVNVNGTPYSHNDVMTIGAYSIILHLQQCS